jgi:hypothetical protein
LRKLQANAKREPSLTGLMGTSDLKSESMRA